MWNIRSIMRDIEYYDEKYRNPDSVIADANRGIKKYLYITESLETKTLKNSRKKPEPFFK